MVNGLPLQQIELIIGFLRGKLRPTFIWLFGSAAKETMNLESDIDLAFSSNDRLDSYQVFMIAQELASKLGRDVDLIDLKKILRL
jgi:uncharacterized protein